MQKNNLFRKGSVFGIIVLFIGVAIAPGITVAIHLSDATSTKIPESENLNNDLVEITIERCKVNVARFPGNYLFSSEEEVKDTDTIVGPKTNSIFGRGTFNFFSKILDAFPILAGFIERFIPKYPEEPEELDELEDPEKPKVTPEKPKVTPEKPKEEPKDETPVPAPETPDEVPPKEEKPTEPEEPILVFDISVEEEFKLGEPIPVIATLTNNGEKAITLCEMNFKTGTLDFYIDTPEGYTIHFIGLVNDSEMRHWRLMPQENRSIDEDIVKSRLFNIDPSPSVTILPYEFIEGEYTITGHYISFATEYTSLDFWEGELDSREYKFTIISQ